MRKELIGYDENGQVFDSGNVISRKIKDDYKQEVRKIFQVYKNYELDKKGIVETNLLDDGNLEHKKMITSYPYEWTANMFKDALLFHLKLFSEMGKAGLIIKDSLPSNIVFDYTNPIFVDFLSLIFSDKLKNEKWLNAKKYKDARFAIIDSMLMPYMVFPFLLICRGDFELAREVLSTRSCNASGKTFGWGEFFRPNMKNIVIQKREYIKSFIIATKLLWYQQILRQNSAGFDKFIKKFKQIINDTDLTPLKSAYSLYYDEKKEETSLDNPSKFLPKQKTVYDIIKASKPKTVLDIGANTGWYSFLACSLGSKVISLESDESCVDILYKRAKKNNLAVLPLKLSFGELTKEVYGVRDDNPIYSGRGFENNPLFRAGIERLKSELVLVLGLSHHLVLGQGYTMDKMFELLAQVTDSILVLEFVDLADEKIVNEPSFFKNIKQFNQENYNIDIMTKAGLKYFKKFEVLKSNPDTRKVVVFSK